MPTDQDRSGSIAKKAKAKKAASATVRREGTAGKDAVEKREERRRFPRHDCHGSGSVQQLPITESPLPAVIQTLSEGGCLMQLPRKHGLTMEERVELTFIVNRLPFRLRALVKSIHARGKIGFEFHDVTERKRGYLQELILELPKSD